jgi:hypothetical protein
VAPATSTIEAGVPAANDIDYLSCHISPAMLQALGSIGDKSRLFYKPQLNAWRQHLKLRGVDVLVEHGQHFGN